VPKREITRNSDPSTGFEEPTDKAALTIMLVDLAGQREPVAWRSKRQGIAVRWKNAIMGWIRQPGRDN
jgi:hypothetical protein